MGLRVRDQGREVPAHRRMAGGEAGRGQQQTRFELDQHEPLGREQALHDEEPLQGLRRSGLGQLDAGFKGFERPPRHHPFGLGDECAGAGEGAAGAGRVARRQPHAGHDQLGMHAHGRLLARGGERRLHEPLGVGEAALFDGQRAERHLAFEHGARLGQLLAHGQCHFVMPSRRGEVARGQGDLAELIRGLGFALGQRNGAGQGRRLFLGAARGLDLALRQQHHAQFHPRHHAAAPVVDGRAGGNGLLVAGPGRRDVAGLALHDGQVVQRAHFAALVADGASDGERLRVVARGLGQAILLVQHHPDVVQRHRGPVPVTDLPPNRQSALVHLARFGQAPVILQQDAEVIERRRHPAAIADRVARRQRLAVEAFSLGRVPQILHHRAKAIERRRQPRPIPGQRERAARLFERPLGVGRLSLVVVTAAYGHFGPGEHERGAQGPRARNRLLCCRQFVREVAQRGSGL